MNKLQTKNFKHIKITPRAYPLADIIDPRNPKATTALQAAINDEVALAQAAPELLRHLATLCLVVETVARLSPSAADLLPLADAARATIAKLNGGAL